MKEFKYVDVDAEHLISLLSFDNAFDVFPKTPEPWRGQENLCLRVTIQEYISFLDNYLDSSISLRTPNHLLKNYVREHRKNLTPEVSYLLNEAFLKDMSAAALREIVWCEEALGKGATRITHESFVSKPYSDQSINDLYNALMRTKPQVEVVSYLSDRGLCIKKSKTISAANSLYYRYAILMDLLAKRKFFWSYQIT